MLARRSTLGEFEAHDVRQLHHRCCAKGVDRRNDRILNAEANARRRYERQPMRRTTKSLQCWATPRSKVRRVAHGVHDVGRRITEPHTARSASYVTKRQGCLIQD
jgi:hypothetical protein